MSWNHRVLRHRNGEGFTFTIHEVYYDPDGTPNSWTIQPVAALGETLGELREELERMLHATGLPVLDEERLVAQAQARAWRDATSEETTPPNQ